MIKAFLNYFEFNSFLPNDILISEEYLSPFISQGVNKEFFVINEIYNFFGYFIKKEKILNLIYINLQN